MTGSRVSPDSSVAPIFVRLRNSNCPSQFSTPSLPPHPHPTGERRWNLKAHTDRLRPTSPQLPSLCSDPIFSHVGGLGVPKFMLFFKLHFFSDRGITHICLICSFMLVFQFKVQANLDIVLSCTFSYLSFDVKKDWLFKSHWKRRTIVADFFFFFNWTCEERNPM